MGNSGWGGSEWDGGGYSEWPAADVGSLDYYRYGRQLNVLAPAPVKVSTRYDAIAEVSDPPPPTPEVDIKDLIVNKRNNKLKNIKVQTPSKFRPDDFQLHGSTCDCCPKAMPPSTLGVDNDASAATVANSSEITFYVGDEVSNEESAVPEMSNLEHAPIEEPTDYVQQ